MTVFYRRMPRFDYLRPRSLEEALAALAEDGTAKDRAYAGGTDVLPRLKARVVKAPPRVIDLKALAELDYLDWNPERGLRIGALATVRDAASSPRARQSYAALARGACEIAANQIRNRATVVGNICSALPSADMAPSLLVHDAKIVCIGSGGERSLEPGEFWRGPGETALAAGELVKEIVLPPPRPGERSVYLKLARRATLALVGVAASVVLEGGVVRKIRIGLGSAGPVPVRAASAETALLGQKLTPESITHAARAAAEGARTRSSHRASGEYRRMMIEVLTRRALTALAS